MVLLDFEKASDNVSHCSVNSTTVESEGKSTVGSELFSATGNNKSSWMVPSPAEMYCQMFHRA